MSMGRHSHLAAMSSDAGKFFAAAQARFRIPAHRDATFTSKRRRTKGRVPVRDRSLLPETPRLP